MRDELFHPSADWLRSNGYEPAKARAVEIVNAARFVQWSTDQPSMLVHELAHGWHDRVLGSADRELALAYAKIVESRSLLDAPYLDGRRRDHYGLTNAQELFAEMSEAYWGRNDFGPHDRAELEKQLPWLADLIAAKWSDPARE